MSLLTEAQGFVSQVGTKCSVGLLLAGPLGSDLAELLDSEVPHSVVARVLGKHDVKISGATVSRHRNRECACPVSPTKPAK